MKSRAYHLAWFWGVCLVLNLATAVVGQRLIAALGFRPQDGATFVLVYLLSLPITGIVVAIPNQMRLRKQGDPAARELFGVYRQRTLRVPKSERLSKVERKKLVEATIPGAAMVVIAIWLAGSSGNTTGYGAVLLPLGLLQIGRAFRRDQ